MVYRGQHRWRLIKLWRLSLLRLLLVDRNHLRLIPFRFHGLLPKQQPRSNLVDASTKRLRLLRRRIGFVVHRLCAPSWQPGTTAVSPGATAATRKSEGATAAAAATQFLVAHIARPPYASGRWRHRAESGRMAGCHREASAG